VKDLTIASNNAGVDDFGLGLLLQTRTAAMRPAGMVSRCFQPWTVLTGTSSLVAIGRMPPNAAMMAPAG